MLETIIKGRFMMIPLMLCSVIALAVIISLLLAIAPELAIATAFVLYAMSAPITWLYGKLFRKSAPMAKAATPHRQQDKEG